MPITAFSKSARRELDASQILEALASRDGSGVAVSLDDIPDRWRAEIRADVECPCCFVTGAEIVKAAKATSTGRAIRQACFRFSEHRPLCDYARRDSSNFTPENLVRFGSDNSKQTKAVRRLVSAGIQIDAFSQQSIREMRKWFFDQKEAASFQVTLDPRVPRWVSDLFTRAQSHVDVDNLAITSQVASLTGFDWRDAAKRQVQAEFGSVMRTLREERVYIWNFATRAEALARKYNGQMAFDASSIRDKYELAIKMTSFITHNYTPLEPTQKRRVGYDPFVIALVALLLFVTDWKLENALSLFAKVAQSAERVDESLGNVIGLNPFHDYEAWRAIKVLQSLDVQIRPDTVEGYIRQIDGQLRAQMADKSSDQSSSTRPTS